ncbi:Tvs1p SKDI_03G1230 [Saccharomyces kudriavzevii IFO 1802]|uniref:YCR061W-like protein n=2 Tax=Saccharomyces kudriavzevii (strain ATCC MYA-4449 / AS 2.2408 / CBS 8840 / NBRC 1802 / NCYC 2889) TaxID=226230 RepID=J6EME5_SACK1|nr:uncharacterized protein SKDI_03G1230 [Saccharomyces kudriavzevii IFO 1802]EJT44202.1 YCR061W-like protein [Saccharomyces kudriavzevii IFO 1802]CAI4056779.1 hypothetical protein SKDI_03G1230 [Saccharomyces kudriavzevii IFO 1802]
MVRFGLILSILGSSAALVSAHGDMDMDMDMDVDVATATATYVPSTTSIVPMPHEPKHLHGLPILQSSSLTPAERLYWENYNTTTYFTTQAGDRPALRYHVFTLLLVAFVLYPVSLALSAARSRWYLPLLLGNLCVCVSSVMALCVFQRTFPEDGGDWYPHNIYATTSSLLLLFMFVHFLAAVLSVPVPSVRKSEYRPVDDAIPLDDLESTPVMVNSARGSPSPSSNRDTLFSLSSGATTHKRDRTGGDEDDTSNHNTLRDEDDNGEIASIEAPPLSAQDIPVFRILFASAKYQAVAARLSHGANAVFHMLTYPLFMYIFVDLIIGYAVGNLLGKGIRIFNLLAHWIKGGVFFTLGVVSLARYCGFGAKYGWAWNRICFTSRLSQERSSNLVFRFAPVGTVTMEFIESFLIFFYGSTNVFLEHLAGSGGAWTAKDLQHVSIAFMFIGTGLCGLLTEYKLNHWRFEHAGKLPQADVIAATPGYSPNPFPAFTIFWTGILMSQHAQTSQFSTTIHTQWGYLLSYGSFFRLLTFLILFLVPNTNCTPSKPFTELITSFCLLCGGLVFMESTDQSIEAMEYRGFTPMFTFNLSVGFVSLLMAWEMLLFIWKDRLIKTRKTSI